MSIVLGADKAGFELKELLKKVIKEEGFEVIDLSETCSGQAKWEPYDPKKLSLA